eukprot:scaffold63_cov306-Pinguiococcus_pyrenoidosus.AAC.39
MIHIGKRRTRALWSFFEGASGAAPSSDPLGLREGDPGSFESPIRISPEAVAASSIHRSGSSRNRMLATRRNDELIFALRTPRYRSPCGWSGARRRFWRLSGRWRRRFAHRPRLHSCWSRRSGLQGRRP